MRFIALTALALAGTAHAGKITVEAAQPLQGSDGMFRCALWTQGDGYPGETDNAFKTVAAKIVDNGAVCTFDGIDKGRYAISILHDANNNGKIDLNMLGIPKEGFGASNDVPPGPMSPPNFEDAAFEFDGTELNMALLMRYLLG